MSDVKTFFHPIKNSTFVVFRAPGIAETLMFANGKLNIPLTDTQALEQLEAVADKRGSPITTGKAGEMTDSKLAAAEVIAMAGKHADKIAATAPKA